MPATVGLRLQQQAKRLVPKSLHSSTISARRRASPSLAVSRRGSIHDHPRRHPRAGRLHLSAGRSAVHDAAGVTPAYRRPIPPHGAGALRPTGAELGDRLGVGGFVAAETGRLSVPGSEKSVNSECARIAHKPAHFEVLGLGSRHGDVNRKRTAAGSIQPRRGYGACRPAQPRQVGAVGPPHRNPGYRPIPQRRGDAAYRRVGHR